jgi:hypothetical protein
MTREEFIAEAKARGLPKEEVRIKFEKLEAEGAFDAIQTTSVSVEEPAPEEPEEDIGWWDEFKLAYDTTYTDVQDWSLSLEAAMPIGNIDFEGGLPVYRSPAELYGADFENMDYEQRKEYLASRREFLDKAG